MCTWHSACSSEAAEVCNQTPAFKGLAVHSFSHDLQAAQLRLWREVLPEQLESLEALWQALAGSPTFREFWADREKRGPFLLPRLAFLERFLTLQDIADGLSAAQLAGEPIPAALGLLRDATEKINSELPPIRTLHELEQVLNFGTVFFNAASKHWRTLAAVCRAAGAALGFPANINVYVTAPGRSTSTPVHSDHHDVLILQTSGFKRWRVFKPAPRDQGCAHPCHRGKNDDVIDEKSLGEPLVDVTLRPGEILFVPMGFLHATSTCTTEEASTKKMDASVHLTLGISVADCGLTYGMLRGQLLHEFGVESAVNEEVRLR